MSTPAKGLTDLGPEHYFGGQVASRGGVARVMAVLKRVWVAVLVVMAVAGVYLAGPRQPEPAKRVALKEPAGLVRSLSVRNGGGVLVAIQSDGTIRQSRIDAGRDRAESGGPAQPGFIAAFSPDGATLAVGDDSTVALRETTNEEPWRTVRTDAGWTLALAFSRDGATLAVAAERGVTLWDTASARRRVELRRVPSRVISLAIAPDSRSLATGGMDGFVRIWDIGTGQEQVAFRAHVCFVGSLAISDDGRFLATASTGEGIARLWDAATGRGLKSFRGHSGPVQCVTFAPRGATVATAASDGTVRLWDVTTGREQATLSYAALGACVIAFSPDGRVLAAGGSDPVICVWDVSRISASPLAMGAGHDRPSLTARPRIADDRGPGPRPIGPQDRGNIGEVRRASDPK